MDNSTLPLPLTGVVPAVCDSEAGDDHEVRTAMADSPDPHSDLPQPRTSP